jgi:hypothetical protein
MSGDYSRKAANGSLDKDAMRRYDEWRRCFDEQGKWFSLYTPVAARAEIRRRLQAYDSLFREGRREAAGGILDGIREDYIDRRSSPVSAADVRMLISEHTFSPEPRCSSIERPTGVRYLSGDGEVIPLLAAHASVQ